MRGICGVSKRRRRPQLPGNVWTPLVGVRPLGQRPALHTHGHGFRLRRTVPTLVVSGTGNDWPSGYALLVPNGARRHEQVKKVLWG